MTGKKNTEEEIELTPAEDNPWYQFYLQSIVFDQGDRDEGPCGSKPYGWHWFWGIYFLHEKMPQFRRFNLTKIQKKLPDGHWLKSAVDDGNENTCQFGGQMPDIACQSDAVSCLHKILQEHNITEAPEEIDFSNLNFAKYTDLSKFIFLIKTSFRKSNFVASADFTQAQFFDFAHFIYTTFIGKSSFPFKGYVFGYTTFQEAVFHRSASFDNIESNEGLVFTATKFIGGATFSGAVFSGVNFDNAEFINSGAVFQKANFSNVASFVETTFSRGAFFEGAEFPESPFYVTFGEANFKSGARFDDVKFLGEAIFYNAKFGGSTVFRGATFSTLAKFGKADISGSINFIDTHFEAHAPYLHDAKIGTGILWDRTNNLWPQAKQDKNNETDAEYKNRIADNQNDYEALVSHMQKLDKHDDAHFFFRQEMRCRQYIAESLTSYIAFWLYELFSDYGYRIGRAFWCWAGHIALGALVIAFIAMCGGMRYHESLPCAIYVSFANANPYVFFGFESSSLKACYTELEPLAPISFAIVKVIQTAFGIALLSLLIITLRTRFRLK